MAERHTGAGGRNRVIAVRGDLRPDEGGYLHLRAVRNGMPDVRPYVWRGFDTEREEWVQARLAAVRAQLAATRGAP